MVGFHVAVPIAELQLMAMYVISVLVGKNRKLQERTGHRTSDIGHSDKTGQAENDRVVYRARLPRGTEPEAAGR